MTVWGNFVFFHGNNGFPEVWKGSNSIPVTAEKVKIRDMKTGAVWGWLMCLLCLTEGTWGTGGETVLRLCFDSVSENVSRLFNVKIRKSNYLLSGNYAFKGQQQQTHPAGEAGIKLICDWLSGPGSLAAFGVVWLWRLDSRSAYLRQHGSQP